MSQVFAGDAVQITGAPSVTTTSETPVATGNFLNPPFGNAKAFVSGTVTIATGAGTTALTARIRRNPNAENVVVASTGPVAATASAGYQLGLQAADAIPDGRPCQYQLTIQQTGASGNGIIQFGSVGALLISG